MPLKYLRYCCMALCHFLATSQVVEAPSGFDVCSGANQHHTQVKLSLTWTFMSFCTYKLPEPSLVVLIVGNIQ